MKILIFYGKKLCIKNGVDDFSQTPLKVDPGHVCESQVFQTFFITAPEKFYWMLFKLHTDLPFTNAPKKLFCNF
jgi:hypothetical protein